MVPCSFKEFWGLRFAFLLGNTAIVGVLEVEATFKSHVLYH